VKIASPTGGVAGKTCGKRGFYRKATRLAPSQEGNRQDEKTEKGNPRTGKKGGGYQYPALLFQGKKKEAAEEEARVGQNAGRGQATGFGRGSTGCQTRKRLT